MFNGVEGRPPDTGQAWIVEPQKEDVGIMIALRQADRLIKGYVKGKYISPPPRDAIEIKKVTRYG